jgi:putative glycosyltransferase (TIGR04372 family)
VKCKLMKTLIQLLTHESYMMKISRIVTRIMLCPLIPVILTIRMISPILLIRFGQTNSSRIGHFAIETEIAQCQKRDKTRNHKLPIIIDLYYVNGNISNEYLFDQWRKVINYYPSWLIHPLNRLNQKIPAARKYNVFADAGAQNLEILDSFKPIIKLEDTDIFKAQKILERIGIYKNDKVVCLCVRDDAYLQATYPSENWKEHSHRDSDIKNYVLAAETLAGLGYKVVRMGKVVKGNLISNSASVIDYANSAVRSDFLDVYLFSKAKFIISNATGMDYLGAIFRVPIGLVNTVTSESIKPGKILKLYQPKTAFDSSDGSVLGLADLVKRGFNFSYHASDYSQMNVRFQENTEEEIKNFALEFKELVEKNIEIIPQEATIQGLRHAGAKNFSLSKISHSWLKAHDYYFQKSEGEVG